MISDFLKFDEPLSIKELQTMTGFTNRKVRKMIEEERQLRKDFVIVSSSHAKGCYKTRDRQKVINYKIEQEHRARMIFHNLKNANAFIKDYGQLKFEALDET